AKVLLLDEHSTVGLPCHDTGWLIETKFTDKILTTLRGKLVLRRVKGFKICNALTGNVLEDIKNQKLGHLTPRADFDKELAKLAINAGAELILNARVTSFLRSKGKVSGVITSSKSIPKVESDITVCATGAAILNSPLAMSSFKDKPVPGVLTELTKVDGFEGGVVEIYKSSDKRILSDAFFWPHSSDTCFSGFPSLKRFDDFKKDERIAFSYKIRNAYPVQAHGYVTSFHGGRAFKRIVDGGVMYVGEAAGASGTIHSMIMGQYAGEVAAKAVQEGDTSSERLSEYQEIFKRSDICKSPFYWYFIKEFYGSYRRCLSQFRKIEV
ncbi:MAG: NAD(P)/FAD-dependent oxidoreductase, partial [Methanobacteriota archaeon]